MASSHNVPYVRCHLCTLPDHPGINCEAESRRLMDGARYAAADALVPYSCGPRDFRPSPAPRNPALAAAIYGAIKDMEASR